MQVKFTLLNRDLALYWIKFFLLSAAFIYLTIYVSARADEQTSGLTIKAKEYKLEQGKVIIDGVQDGSAAIEKLLDSTFSLSTYAADYKMKAYKNRQILNEEGTFYFSKPKLLRLEVKKGSRKGSLAILEEDGKIHGHLGGLMKYFNGTVDADSSFARAINGFPSADTDFYSLAAYLKNMLKKGDMSLVTSEAKQTNKCNHPTYILDICSAAKPIKLVLQKRIYVDAETYLPVFWEDYVDSKIWSESSWQNVRTNLRLPNDFFRL